MMINLVSPSEVNEFEYKELVNDFTVAGEDLIPSALNQGNLSFHAHARSLEDYSIELNINPVLLICDKNESSFICCNPKEWRFTRSGSNDKRQYYTKILDKNLTSALTLKPEAELFWLSIERGFFGNLISFRFR